MLKIDVLDLKLYKINNSLVSIVTTGIYVNELILFLMINFYIEVV